MPTRTRPSDSDAVRSARTAMRDRLVGCLAWPFAILFLGIGGALFCGFGLGPWWGVLSARNWIATPCTVVSSATEADGDGGLRLAIVFTYAVDRKEYRSDTYCFSSMSSNTANAWKERVVQAHPPGRRTTCYVDPGNPARAVVERGWVPDMWWGFFPIPFMVFGAGALLVALGAIRLPTLATRPNFGSWKPVEPSRARSGDDGDSGLGDARVAHPRPEAPVSLEAVSSPRTNFFLALFMAVFANGIISVFVWHAYQQFRDHGVAGLNWFHVVFPVPFVVIGLGLIAGVLYASLALFNPRPTLTVHSRSVPLGGELRLQWTVAGRFESIRRFTVSLQGVEQATHRRGTTTCTDRATFATTPVFETFEVLDIPEGRATVVIPADTMHSFAAAHNKVEWSLVVHGDIRFWPDMSATYPIVVLPRPTQVSR